MSLSRQSEMKGDKSTSQQESDQLQLADGKEERLVMEPATVSLCVFSAHILTPICLGKSRLTRLGAEGYCTEPSVHP